MAETNVQVIQWIVDTRNLWPEATKPAQLETVVSTFEKRSDGDKHSRNL
jgi:hypothetical protein